MAIGSHGCGIRRFKCQAPIDQVFGGNNRRQVVGLYTVENEASHGFVWQVAHAHDADDWKTRIIRKIRARMAR